jgi:hypothetical protein
LILILLGSVLPVSAAHIRGGELYYKYLGPGAGANTSTYLVTLKLYIDCGQNDPGQLDKDAFLSVFTKPDNKLFLGKFAPMIRDEFIRYDPNSNPCITNPPIDVCYRLRYYEYVFTLPNSPLGYTIAFQRCCRIEGIQNISPPSNDFGATYLCEIPGTNVGLNAIENSSPVVNSNDAVAVCMGSNFVFDFSATDTDNDSLVYEFCNAYQGGGPGTGDGCIGCPVPVPGAPPPYKSLFYASPYSGTNPMGNVTINRSTGIVSGVAPARVGQYVVTVCISEYRQGIIINTHRKDIHLKVSDCLPLKAKLDPDYSYCDDFQVTFRNMQINPTGTIYTWDFGDGSPIDTSIIPDGNLQHKYADTGTYIVKLKVVLAGKCVDSAKTRAHVFPGFFPGFTYNGACIFTPFEFKDITKSRYGKPSFWRWDFGDETAANDSSRLSNPQWLYHSLGKKIVQLIVASDKGCRDTVPVTVEVKDIPDLTLPFKDTLICSIDSLQLKAIGDGVFEWTPAYNIISSNTATPIVYPKLTTTYKVKMTENRCVASGEIKVRVVDSVTLYAGNDTTICLTDTIQLRPSGDGLQYLWTSTPVAYFMDARVRNPFTLPLALTTYHVIANIGRCVKEDELNVRTVPYPVVDAGHDAIICYDDSTRLTAYTNGSSFTWQPALSMLNANTLAPTVFPLSTRTYTLFAYDTLGCPKPGVDRIQVTVRPEIIAFAGNDTAVVKGQPLQLKGSGSDFYSWSPETGLTRSSISDPVAIINKNTTFVMKTYNNAGCYSVDSVKVEVFQTQPDIFMPNAFIPGGRNNELRPKAVGISVLDYFRVFNRWGQLVFQTSQLGKGWNGSISGIIQNSGTYVWVISATDYTGKKVIKKGTATLIR